jgi:eukaryotic-like serine/threonine-protein kinase
VQLPTNALQQIHFAEFELDLATCELRTDGLKIDLQGQPFQILLALLERPGQLVTREDLKKRLWPSDTFVDFDHSLNRAVNRLREALEDSAEHPRFVETLPRRGYRFIAPLDGLPTGTAGATPSGQESSSRPPAGHATAPSPIEGAAATCIAAAAAPVPVSSPQIPVGLGKSKYVVITAISVVIAVVATFGLYVWQTRRGPLSLAEIQINKLTDSGAVGDMAISPDGRYVVYARRDGEKESLWLRQVTTRREVQILPSGPEFHGLTFSPDGNYVYFVRSDPNDPFFKYLYSIPVLGGPARQMIADVDSPVSFSPDGHQFAFERGVASRNVVELRIANADGSGDRLVTTIQNGDVGLFQPGPNWSPDGRTIVASFRIVGRPRRWVLASISASDGSVREIYSSPVPIGRPVWLLRGQSLLVPHYDPAYQRTQLWTISYPEGIARRFTNDLTDYDSQLDITRDGRIVAAIASTWTSNVWVAPAADPSRARQITFGELSMLDIAEVADGKLLSASGDGGLWLMNSDGSQRAPFGEAHEAGSVTPCGRFILFVSYEAGTVTLTRVDTDGTHSTKLVSGDLYAPACSPDGRFVFYVNGHQPQRIWRMSIEGGSPVAIAPGMGNGIGPLGVSPDGRLLAYTFDEYPPAWKIAVIPVGGGPPMKTFKVPGGIRSMRWSPNGAGLQYLLTHDGATNVWEQPLAGGVPKQLTKFTSGEIADFNWSPDYKRLLLTRGSLSSDVVLLRKFR